MVCAGIWRDVAPLDSVSSGSSLLYASSFDLVSFRIIALLRPARPRLCTAITTAIEVYALGMGAPWLALAMYLVRQGW